MSTSTLLRYVFGCHDYLVGLHTETHTHAYIQCLHTYYVSLTVFSPFFDVFVAQVNSKLFVGGAWRPSIVGRLCTS
jgi:hypothetical protein